MRTGPETPARIKGWMEGYKQDSWAFFNFIRYSKRLVWAEIKTLILARIQALFGSSHGLFNSGIWASFEGTSFKST